MSTVPITFRIDEGDKAELERAARETDRSASYILGQALREYLAHRREYIDDLRAAVTEADGGVFISNAAVHDWLRSLDTDAPKPFPKPDVFSTR